MNNQKLDEISQAQTQENSKQLEEVDVHEKKKKQQKNHTCKGMITYQWAMLFSCESYILSIQITGVRINNGHLLCSDYSRLNSKGISLSQNYLYFENLFAFANNKKLIRRARSTGFTQAQKSQDFLKCFHNGKNMLSYSPPKRFFARTQRIKYTLPVSIKTPENCKNNLVGFFFFFFFSFKRVQQFMKILP